MILVTQFVQNSPETKFTAEHMAQWGNSNGDDVSEQNLW
jgi:hypothetical protein